MNTKTYIIGGIGVIILIIVGWMLFSGGGPQDSTPLAESKISRDATKAEPVDVVLDFYNAWLEARHSTSTDPYESGLSRDPLLGDELRAKIAQAYGEKVDPVVCHESIPAEVRTKVVLEGEGQGQVLVLPDAEGVDVRPLVTLAVIEDLWYITDISCSTGESEPEREFSFDRDGFLLKQSVPAPFNPQHWHVVFEENGVMGHTAPLFFDAESNCRDANDNEIGCPSDAFGEAKKVTVQGQMSEAGVEVKRLQIVE